MRELRVVYTGSHLFAPTHYALLGLMRELLALKVDARVLAKHPMAHMEWSVRAPEPLCISDVWSPDADLVHAVGGGETAIRVANSLAPGIPLIISFVGATDLTRQLEAEPLQGGYAHLFKRATFVTFPDHCVRERLTRRGAPVEKLIHLPPPLPLSIYPHGSPPRTGVVIVPARSIARKRHERALEFVRGAPCVRKLICVGGGRPSAGCDPRVQWHEYVPHGLLTQMIAESDVLLQTCDWTGPEVDLAPTVVLEALAMGVPVISTPLAGVFGLATRFPFCVRMVTTGEEFHQAVECLLMELPHHELAQAREWVNTTHNPRHVAARLLELYEEALW